MARRRADRPVASYRVKVMLFGATGLVGQGLLRESLRDDRVTAGLTVGRAATGQEHPKLRELVHSDLLDLEPVADQLEGYHACLFCLGVSAVGRSEEEYRRITHNLTLFVAQTLRARNRDLGFVYVSGAGTDEGSRMLCARVKGRTENALLDLFPGRAYMFRPGFIQPRHGIRPRTRLYHTVYAVANLLLPLLGRLVPDLVADTERLGRTMLTAACCGAPTPVLENRDINALATSA